MTGALRVTQLDVARQYGCSRATVSLALSGHPRISDKVRREIVALADRLGYRPDPSLSMLARDRFARRPAGFRAVLAYLVHPKVRYSNQLRHLAVVQRCAARNGYHVERFDLSRYISGESAAKVLFNRGIRGVIIPCMPMEVKRYITPGAWDDFTVVCCSLGWVRFDYNVVTNDVFAATRLVWNEVVSRGYRRIGAAMFRHDPVAEDDHARYGASVALQELLVPPAERLPILVDCGPRDRDRFLRWFERHRPEVVISFVSRACEWLTSAGYRVPEDVAFACLNVWPHERYTGVAIDDDAMGEAALEFLVAQLQHNQHGLPKLQRLLMLAPRWLEGRTLPRRT